MERLEHPKRERGRGLVYGRREPTLPHNLRPLIHELLALVQTLAEPDLHLVNPGHVANDEPASGRARVRTCAAIVSELKNEAEGA